MTEIEITLDLRKSVEENAQMYYEKSKKSKRKMQGLLEMKKKIAAQVEKEQEKHDAVTIPEPKVQRKKAWFEKFRWCYLSNGMLAIGGRDATTNEMVIKKHTLPEDIVFHTDMSGAPFVVLKTEGKEVTSEIMEECAILCGIYSKAWQRGFTTIEVFAAKPEQVTKEAQTGEYLSKGAFMVRGEVTYFRPSLSCAIGMYDDAVMAGPVAAVEKNCSAFERIIQGDMKTSQLAKELAKRLQTDDIDAIIRALPTGGCALEKKKK